MATNPEETTTGSLSGITIMGSSSLEENSANFQKDFGLDATTARLLYKADVFLENDQLKKAQTFYKMVLEVEPSCSYAAMNLKAAKELFQTQQRQTQKRNETTRHEQIEMSVEWIAYCDQYQDDDYNEIAIKKVKEELQEKGYSQSFFRLIENEVFESENIDNTYLETKGRAHFRVTLIADKKEEESAKEAEIMEPPPRPTKQETQQVEITGLSRLDISAPTPPSNTREVDSKFADASEGE